MRLAARDDADRPVGGGDDGLVDARVPRERPHGVELVDEPLLDHEAGQVGPAIVEPAGRRDVADRRSEDRRHAIEVDGRAALDRLRDRLEPDPCARETRQRPSVEPELEHLRDVRGIDDRHRPRLHREIALMRHRRRHATVIVSRDDEHAAVRRRAVRVAVLERIARAIDARPLAVPEREDAGDGAGGVAFDLLRSQDRGGREFFVDRWKEADALGLEQRRGAPHLLIDRAERRAAIPADIAGGLEAARAIERALHQRQPHEGLRPGEEDLAARRAEIVRESIVEPQVGYEVSRGRIRAGRRVHGVDGRRGHRRSFDGEADMVDEAASADNSLHRSPLLSDEALRRASPDADTGCRVGKFETLRRRTL